MKIYSWQSGDTRLKRALSNSILTKNQITSSNYFNNFLRYTFHGLTIPKMTFSSWIKSMNPLHCVQSSAFDLYRLTGIALPTSVNLQMQCCFDFATQVLIKAESFWNFRNSVLKLQFAFITMKMLKIAVLIPSAH